MSRLRPRRRLARTLARAHGVRSSLRREWRWALRDLRDLRSELGRLAEVKAQLQARPLRRRGQA